MRVAEEGVEALSAHVDSLIVVLNEKLEDVMGEDAEMDACFKCADDVLHNAVAGIAEIIKVEGLINVDFEDVKTVMSEQGKAMMGTASASGADRARIAAEQAVTSPLLEGVDLSGARGVLVNITASRSLKLRETRTVMETISAFAAEDATVIFGAVYDDTMGDELRVTVVATGLGRVKQRPQLVTTPAQVATPHAMLKTGTDNAAMGAQPAPGMQPSVNYESFETPAVWRNSRETAAARVSALEESGMDRLEIPAFLRKQAD
jgi:cell division protein FtsZ